MKHHAPLLEHSGPGHGVQFGEDFGADSGADLGVDFGVCFGEDDRWIPEDLVDPPAETPQQHLFPGEGPEWAGEPEQQLAMMADLVAELADTERQVRVLEHRKQMQLARLNRATERLADATQPRPGRTAGRHVEMVHRAIEAEVAHAINVSEMTAARKLAYARELADRYPVMSRDYHAAELTQRHVEVMLDAATIVTDPCAQEHYEQCVLPLARRMTPAQLRPHAKRLAELFSDDTLDKRHAEAKRCRGVQVTPLDDGLAEVSAVLGAIEAYAIKDRLARIAYRVHELRADTTENADADDSSAATDNVAAAGSSAGDGDESRPSLPVRVLIRETQADIFTDLLLTGAGTLTTHTSENAGEHSIAAIHGRVQVSVPALTLINTPTGVRTAPAELQGYGPIDTETARQLAGHAPGWDRVLTHPVTGVTVAVDRYRPSEEMRRFLGARDEHCRFPGCRRRLDHCDIDHTIAWQDGGPTATSNLAHLCRKHHTLKHFTLLEESSWRPTQLADGEIEWDSPLGNTYRDIPASTVRFTPVEPPPNSRTDPPDNHSGSPDPPKLDDSPHPF